MMMMMQSRANPPPPPTRASAVHRRRRHQSSILSSSGSSSSSSFPAGEKEQHERFYRRRHPISNTNIVTRKAFRKKKSAVITRGGFLEDAMEFAKQKSSEVEEAIKSVTRTTSRSSSNKRLNVEELKEALLSKIATVERGASASEEDKEEIDLLAQKVENTQKRKNALETEEINGKWELMYTTSASILGLTKPKIFQPSGPIYQTIDAKNLRAFNSESAPFFNQVSAELTPTTKSSVNVQFKKFGLFGGLIKINAPESAKGKLDTTFVDEDLRISRGDKGNLFVLLMRDRSANLDAEY